MMVYTCAESSMVPKYIVDMSLDSWQRLGKTKEINALDYWQKELTGHEEHEGLKKSQYSLCLWSSEHRDDELEEVSLMSQGSGLVVDHMPHMCKTLTWFLSSPYSEKGVFEGQLLNSQLQFEAVGDQFWKH